MVSDADSQQRGLAQNEELDSRRKMPVEALTVLNDRERRIFEARRLAEKPSAFDELAEQFCVSRKRVRQIDLRVFEKVQKAILDRMTIPDVRGPFRKIESNKNHF